jgi:hypothetical protein
MGQQRHGQCWLGLLIDANDNVYPSNGSGLYKILPDGTLVNGVNDQNLFASFPASRSYELDASTATLYALDRDVFSAPFLEGTTFSVLISGLGFGRALALGRGPLTGSLFATEAAIPGTGGLFDRVNRVTLSPLGLSVFASGLPFFKGPKAVASGPDGTLYVANLGFNPSQLTKITPGGVPSTFAVGSRPQVNGAVIVDNAGNVFWSHETGINKYDANGTLLGKLPPPPSGRFFPGNSLPLEPAQGTSKKRVFRNPVDAAFDSNGNLYVVDNGYCKTIYKYTLD